MSTEDDSTTVIEFPHGGAPAPVLPNNVVESMLAGIPVPALPGIEDLFAPLIELGKSLGTGTFAGIDPVGIFDQASTLIDHAMGLSRSAVAEVSQTWNSTGSDAATELSRSAQNSGAELSERGTAISKTAAAAAESVQRGNANLAAIAQSFATTVAAAAPIAWTPPGQAMLLASAAEHMQAAVAAVTRTRGEMLGHTAAMNALAGPIPVPTPPTSEALSNLITAEASNNAARQIAQPLSASTDAGDAPYSTHPDSTQPGTEAVRTSAAQAGAGLPTGVAKLWGAGNPSTSLAAGASPSPQCDGKLWRSMAERKRHYRRNDERRSGSCCSSTGSNSNARPGCTVVGGRQCWHVAGRHAGRWTPRIAGRRVVTHHSGVSRHCRRREFDGRRSADGVAARARG